ncbi:MAG TPA: cation:proton antiporter [Candidatus Baltobacterales bacterium]|nr:cation:proton antiporter [Candidatus Baltobacterales bacterium]
MFTSLTLVVLAGLLGPLLAAGRRPLTPVLVGELIAGAIIGRTWLHLIVSTTQPLPEFSAVGFAMLMLEAGNEVDLRSTELRVGAVRGNLALLIALALSVPVGLGISALFQAAHPSLLVVLLAGSSAAVAFPTIRERGLTGPAIAILITWMTVADALTAVLMPLTLSGASRIPLALVGDGVIVLVAAASMAAARRLFKTGLSDEVKRESKHRHWALQLRLSVLLLLALAAIAERTGASLLVAGFAAGIVLRRFNEPNRLAQQLTGLASGFFVPAFFVLLGASLDLSALVRSPSAIGLAVAMAIGATAVHVMASLATGTQSRLSAGLLASAQLGLPAAAASVGLASGALGPAVAAALVAGGVLTLVPASAGALMLGRNPAGPTTEEVPGGPSAE